MVDFVPLICTILGSVGIGVLVTREENLSSEDIARILVNYMFWLLQESKDIIMKGIINPISRKK